LFMIASLHRSNAVRGEPEDTMFCRGLQRDTKTQRDQLGARFIRIARPGIASTRRGKS
jgi:hypothetical protein